MSVGSDPKIRDRDGTEFDRVFGSQEKKHKMLAAVYPFYCIKLT